MSHTPLTREDVFAAVAANRDAFVALGVRRLALFGSVGRNSARPDSDVDFLVEFESGRKTLDALIDVSELLERQLGHAIELVTTESLSPHIGPHILREARDVFRTA